MCALLRGQDGAAQSERYFRLLLIGYFEGIDSERGIAWRAVVWSSPTPAFGYRLDIKTIASASGTGSGRNKTESTIAKITTFTAMHTDSVTITVEANSLPFRRDLLPYLLSRIRLFMIFTQMGRHTSSYFHIASGVPKDTLGMLLTF